EPQYPVEAEVLAQPRLDLGLAEMWVTVGIEQALLGRHHEAGAVGIDRSALEDPVHPVARQPSGGGHGLADLLIAFHDELAAPAVEAEAPGDALARFV